MTVHPLTDGYSVTADWFLPHEPARIIPGTITYSPGRIGLELQDTFAPLEGAVFGIENVDCDRIYGRSRSGEEFTLIHPTRHGLSLTLGRAALVQPDRFSARLLIIGAHTDADPLLPDLSCRVPGLAVWLSRPAIETTLEAAGGGISMNFHVAPMPGETFRIPALNATLTFDVQSTAKHDPYSLNLTTTGSWRLVPDTPQPLSWYLRQITSLTALLSLCAGTMMSPDCITIPVAGHHERVSVLARLAPEKYCTISDARFFFLARGTLQAHFEQCLSRWFELYPAFETTNALAMSILASDQLWPHVEFLSLMQALEGFHRAQHDGLYMPADDYPAVVDALINAIPAVVGRDHKNALKTRIGYGNEISLNKRLALLCRELAQSIRTILFDDSPSLLRRWTETRNYYTHWDNALRDQILDGQNLVYAIARLRALLRVLYLDAIGIPQEIIFEGLIGFNAEAQFLIQIRGAERRKTDPDDTTGAFMFITRRPKASPEPAPEEREGSATETNEEAH